MKIEMTKRARLSYGLLNLLKDDIDTMNIDIRSNDISNLGETICETRITIQKLIDNLAEIGHLMCMLKK